MDAINALLDRIRTQGIGASAEINPFWRRLVESFAPVLDSGERVSASALNKAHGYGAARLPAGVASNRDMPIWAELMRAADTGEVGGLGKQIEHAAILRFLREKEVLDDYVATLDRFRLVSKPGGPGRLYWYAVRLSRLLRRRGGDAPRVFLEIGSGAGFFAMLMSDAGLVRHYVMVDLPEMLLNAMLHARDYLPGVQIRFGETPDFSRSEQTFWSWRPARWRGSPTARWRWR
ncbi:MAG: class I SAM-dependent methyltransferase [Caulobacteraceae bacterium]